MGREYTTEKGPAKIENTEEALGGARDILAERVNDDAAARARLREIYTAKGVIKSKVIAGKEEEGAKFKDYFDWTEPASAAPSPSGARHSPRRSLEGFLFYPADASRGERASMRSTGFL